MAQVESVEGMDPRDAVRHVGGLDDVETYAVVSGRTIRPVDRRAKDRGEVAASRKAPRDVSDPFYALFLPV